MSARVILLAVGIALALVGFTSAGGMVIGVAFGRFKLRLEVEN